MISRPRRTIAFLRGQGVRGQLQFLLSDAAVFGTVGLVSSFASFLLVPLIVRMFSVAEYGLIDAIRTFAASVATLLILGLEQASARFISLSEDMGGKRQIAGEGLSAALASSIVGGGVVFVLAPYLGRPLFSTNSRDLTLSLQLVAVSMPFRIVYAFALMLLKWHFRRFRYVVLSVLYSVGVVVFTAIAVVPLHLGIVGVFEAQLAAGVGAFAVALCYCYDLVSVAGPSRTLRAMVRYGIPLMATASFSNLQPLIERFLIIRFFGLNELGFYSVAQSLCRFAKLPVDGFLIAWSPFALATHHQNQAAKTFNAVLLWFVILGSALYLPTVLLAKPALTFVASQKYAVSSVLIAPLAFALFAEAAASITSINIFLTMRTAFYMFPAILQIIVLVGAAVYLRSFSLPGFALAYLLSKVAFLVCASAIGHYMEGIRYDFLRPAMVGTATFVIGVVFETALNGGV